MAWTSRGLRGQGLEDMINMTNEKYRDNNLALIQKIPTPIKPINIDKENHHITLAYFEQKSTVDYIGVVQGIPVCFDAKECSVDTFPMQNIHEHQILFMKDFEKQGGIAFIIIYYTHKNELYYVPLCDILKFYERSISGGRKSFTYEEVNKAYKITTKNGVMIHYLETIQKDIENR